MSVCYHMSKICLPILLDTLTTGCPKWIGFGRGHLIRGRLPSGRSWGRTGRCHYSNDNNRPRLWPNAPVYGLNSSDRRALAWKRFGKGKATPGNLEVLSFHRASTHKSRSSALQPKGPLLNTTVIRADVTAWNSDPGIYRERVDAACLTYS